MNTSFLLNGLDVDASVREYVEKKLESPIKLLSQLERVEVEVEQDKRGFYRVEVTLYEPRNTYRAEETTQTIEAAADIVADELKEQIRHNREKRTTLTRRGARSIKKKSVIDESARF